MSFSNLSTLFTSPLNSFYYLKTNNTIVVKLLLGILIHYIYFKILMHVYQYMKNKKLFVKIPFVILFFYKK
jgi:hypothetical protein